MATVVIAAGGTAGHVVPALAVADALRASGAEVSFVGDPRSAPRRELVPAAGYEIDFLRARGASTARNPIRALAAAGAPRRRGDRRRRGGCCASAAPTRSGRRRLRRRARSGSPRPALRPAARAHRGRPPPRPRQPAAGAAGRDGSASPSRSPGATGERYLVTGQAGPAPRCAEADRDVARERFGIAPDARCLLVFGGSQGARSINAAPLDAFARRPGGTAPRLPRPAHRRPPRPRRGSRSASMRRARARRYTLLEYEPDLADASPHATWCWPASGGSVFELAAAGRPAILVPYPLRDRTTTSARTPPGWPRRARRS